MRAVTLFREASLLMSSHVNISSWFVFFQIIKRVAPKKLIEKVAVCRYPLPQQL
jgi:hypothetical protein